MCTWHKTPMDCCCWLKAYAKVRTKLIFFFLFCAARIAATTCGAIVIECSLTITADAVLYQSLLCVLSQVV